MSENGRRAIHAYLSPAAYQGWVEAADSMGVSLSGLLEAIGVDLADNNGRLSGIGDKQWSVITAESRKVDASRRRRTFRRSD